MLTLKLNNLKKLMRLLLKHQHLQPVAVEERNMIKLELTVEEVNNILMALGKAPYEFSQPIVDKIKQQAIPQVQHVAPVEVVAE
jgi:hypothetical protein